MEVFDQEVGVQGVGVVEVDDVGVRMGNVADVFVVGIVRQVGDVLGAHALQNGVGDGRLAGAGTTGHTDSHDGR